MCTGIALKKVPMVSIRSAKAIVPSVPIFLVNSGVNTEKIPNAKTGSVVSNPRRLLESPVSIRISLTSGPTAVKEGLRFREIRIMTSMKRYFFFFSGDIYLFLIGTQSTKNRLVDKKKLSSISFLQLNEFSNAFTIHIIFLDFKFMKNIQKISFIFLLVYGVILWITACSSSVNSVENIPPQVLASSSEGLMIEGKQITLNAQLNRDFAPSSPEDGRPLIARVEIVTSNGDDLPNGLETDAVWVMVDDEVWGSSYAGEQFKDDKSRIVKIARGGPKFGVGKKADVIVRIYHNGKSYLLKASGQEITKSV